MNTNEIEASGVLLMRKPRGKKLTFLIGGPSLDFCQKYTTPCKDMVYVWLAHDNDYRVEWSTIAPAIN